MRIERKSSVLRHRMALTGGVIALTIIFTSGAVSAGDVQQDFEDFFGHYRHRIEGVTVGAGDAAASNTASQIIDPWPPYARDRRIRSESQRMIGAIRRYQNNSNAAPILIQPTPQSNDGGDDGGQDDAAAAKPDAAAAPSSKVPAGE